MKNPILQKFFSSFLAAITIGFTFFFVGWLFCYFVIWVSGGLKPSIIYWWKHISYNGNSDILWKSGGLMIWGLFKGIVYGIGWLISWLGKIVVYASPVIGIITSLTGKKAS